MRNGWTGGQYSLVRALLGLCLLGTFVLRIGGGERNAIVLTGAVASLAFLLGFFDRVAAVILACVVVYAYEIGPGSVAVLWLLVAHVIVPRAPYGSWAARGRVDPRGGWHFPRSLYALHWIAMVAVLTILALTRPSDAAAALGATLAVLYLPLALSRRARPWIWTAMLLMHLGLLVLIDFAELSFGMVILHLFTFDPAWLPARASEKSDVVFYDGTCGLCHRLVRLLLAEDASGSAFEFAPLGGARHAATFDAAVQFPDSVVVRTGDGRTLIRSQAAIHLLARLGGYWRMIAAVSTLLPRRLADVLYDLIAGVRYYIFGRAKSACPILPPDLRSRFGE